MNQDDVIYEYTDDQAIEDGLLVPVSEFNITLENSLIDRITISLWAQLVESVSHNEDDSLNKVELEAAIAGLLTGGKTHEHMWVFETKFGIVWACQNERGRWTLMFPADY